MNEDLIKKNCNQESDEGYFLDVDVQSLDQLHDLHNNLPFLPERMKIEKFVANFHDKTEYLIHREFKANIKGWISFEKSS